MSFRALINGKEGDAISFAKASDVALKLLILADDGGEHALSTATVDLLVYSRSDRTGGVIATHAAVVVTAAEGICTVAIADSAANYGPGRYYAFARRTLSGDIQWGNKPTIFDVK